MSRWAGSHTGRPGRRSNGPSASHRRRQASERDGCAGIEHPLDLPVSHPECRCGVGHPIEPLTIHADARVRARTQRRAAAGRALGGDQPLVVVWIATGEHGRKVRPLHDTDEPGAFRCTAEPSAGFLATVGVVPLGPTGARRRSRTGSRSLGRRLEVADDRVHDADCVGPPAAERRHREPHREPRAGGPAGFPKGNLQMCARRTCRFAAT